MLSILLFVFYFILLSLALTRIKKIKQLGISPVVLLAAFSFKVALGCIYGYIFLQYYGGDDTWQFHREALAEYPKMIHHPIDFLKDFLPLSAFARSHSFWGGVQQYIVDLENWSIRKLLAFFMIFSRGNYYINVLFFDFVIFSGPLLLFKLLSSFFPTKKTVLIAVIFFIPSTTFWLSGIRSEGLLLLSMVMAIYYSHAWFLQKKPLRLIFAVAGLAGILVFRQQFLFTFIPAFVSWTLCRGNSRRAIPCFGVVYIISMIIFFGTTIISEKENLPALVVEAQQGFFRLHGNTSFKLDTLQPSLQSFTKMLPQAFANTLLRPFIWEAKGTLQSITAIGVMASWVLFLLFIFFHEKNREAFLLNPLLLLFLFYGITQVLLIGYTVPFPGAIVRYTVIPVLFITLSFAIMIDWNKLLDRLN